MVRGQEAARKVFKTATRDDSKTQDDKARQVSTFGAQAIVDPRSEARPSGVVRASVQEEHSRRMDRQIGLHRTNHCQLIGVCCDVREQTANWHPAVAVLPKRPRTLQPLSIAVRRWVLRF